MPASGCAMLSTWKIANPAEEVNFTSPEIFSERFGVTFRPFFRSFDQFVFEVDNRRLMRAHTHVNSRVEESGPVTNPRLECRETRMHAHSRSTLPLAFLRFSDRPARPSSFVIRWTRNVAKKAEKANHREHFIGESMRFLSTHPVYKRSGLYISDLMHQRQVGSRKRGNHIGRCELY